MEYNIANKNNKWPNKTNIDCLWCCHSFDTYPFGIPIKIVDNTATMFGNFCSPECAAAYNFDSNNIETWERYSLLNYLYNNKIKLAPPRLCLKRFGGKLSINEFRKTNNNYDKNFMILLPPMISVIPMVEEINMNEYDYELNNSNSNNFNNLKLKRSKPLPDTMNTLENCMNLKCV